MARKEDAVHMESNAICGVTVREEHVSELASSVIYRVTAGEQDALDPPSSVIYTDIAREHDTPALPSSAICGVTACEQHVPDLPPGATLELQSNAIYRVPQELIDLIAGYLDDDTDHISLRLADRQRHIFVLSKLSSDTRREIVARLTRDLITRMTSIEASLLHLKRPFCAVSLIQHPRAVLR